MDLPRTPPRTPNSKAVENDVIQSLGKSPFDQKFLLTLDGGGIRGYASLLILEKLMQMCEIVELSKNKEASSSYHPLDRPPSTSHRSQYLPAHYFDYIAGTSTGGLIAIMLGRLRMTVDDCLETYKDLGENIFGKPRWWSKRGPFPANRGKYSHRKLKDAIKHVIRTHSQGREDDRRLDEPIFRMEDNDGIRCRVIIPAFEVKPNVDPLYLFRTYNHPHPTPSQLETQFGTVVSPGNAPTVQIWKVARATSAAPTFFKPMAIGETKFLDGGFGTDANNPTHHAFNEVVQMHGNDPRNVALTVSIGTGVPTRQSAIGNGFFGDLKAIIQYSIEQATQSEKTHTEHTSYCSYNKLSYVRFNPDRGLGDIDFCEWRTKTLKKPTRKVYLTLASIKEITEEYLKEPAIQEKMRTVANQLVESRQRRSRDPRWRAAAAPIPTE